jgi:hypothetical protein
MKIKVLWGFCGDVEKLGPDTNGDKVSLTRAGQVFEHAEDEYAHTLIGKALVQQLGDAAPASTKPATAPFPSQPGPAVTLQPAPFDIKVVGLATTSADPDEAVGAPSVGVEALTGATGNITTTTTTTSAPAPPATAELGTEAEKAALITELEAAGVTFDRRWGVAKLAEALKSAQGAKAE